MGDGFLMHDGIKSLAVHVQHDRVVLADRLNHHQVAPCGNGFVDDFEGFKFYIFYLKNLSLI
jgi:hypothetical protein